MSRSQSKQEQGNQTTGQRCRPYLGIAYFKPVRPTAEAHAHAAEMQPEAGAKITSLRPDTSDKIAISHQASQRADMHTLTSGPEPSVFGRRFGEPPLAGDKWQCPSLNLRTSAMQRW